ncbi:hypothetical protein Mal15_43140 [Stieleria maiorica]|uniref:Uncharacterized protein n=1 Tax=Stieleria maiorica TaxID=2795974 RepID=A0A5B9MH71_9BACT|nr:hypothetical protein [Stieleria maiorica]QEG00244.1 hypothetical protein Mal15_43140 [Stieleria maiorica]
MSDYDQHPGGGFSSVDGYNDPAGSQAEEMRRMQEDELNRQRQEQAAADAAAAAEQAAAEQAAAQQAAQQRTLSRTDRNERCGAAGRQSTRSTGGTSNASRASRSTRPAGPSDWNPAFATLGFIAAGLWGMGLLEGDGRLFSGVVTGLVGGYIAGHYYKMLIAATLVGGGWWLISQHEAAKSRSEKTLVTAADVTSTPRPALDTPARPATSPRKSVDARFAKSTLKTPRQTLATRSSSTDTPELLQRPHQELVTDPSRMRAFRQSMLDFETRTGKSFLNDHRSMKPAMRTHFDYFACYADGELQDGQETIPELQPIQGVWDYRSPQLWELDLIATVDQHFLFKSTRANGTKRDGVFRTYSGDGLCYQPMTRPLRRSGATYADFQLPVRGGRVWREFARAVYQAKTDAELLALDPINQAVTKTHQRVAGATAREASPAQAMSPGKIRH